MDTKKTYYYNTKGGVTPELHDIKYGIEWCDGEALKSLVCVTPPVGKMQLYSKGRVTPPFCAKISTPK